MIKNIIFDIAGVYFKGRCGDFLDKSHSLLGIKSNTEKNEVVFDEKYNQGLISTEECFRNVFKCHDISKEEMKNIKNLWTNTWKIDLKMKNLAKKLKKNYKLAVLSNSDILNSEKYKKKGWYDCFDVVVLSHEVGILKPDPKIYEIVLKKLNSSPAECVFIDDQVQCIDSAKEIGMKTILFKSIHKLESELIELGVIL